jgi:hypothetical protein
MVSAKTESKSSAKVLAEPSTSKCSKDVRIEIIKLLILLDPKEFEILIILITLKT